MLASHGLPTPVVDIRLQFSCNHGRDTLLQPDIPIQSIISFVVEKELPATPQSGIGFPISVEIRREIEAAIPVVKVKYAALPNIEEEPCIDATPVKCVRLLLHTGRLGEKGGI